MLSDILRELAEGADHGILCPEPESLKSAIREVMRGEAPPAQLAALLMGLRVRGEQAEHLQAAVEVMLENATPFPDNHTHEYLFDTCGTGGDHHGTVNISTAAALVAAAAGIPVAKHGNRAFSSKSGSADVLEALGMKIDCSPATSVKMLNDLNFCFLFAPAYHPAMRHAGPVRREMKIRTIFNLAGPLSNPARPTHQLVGVPKRELVEPIAHALRLLGRRRALVVHGRNGEDEISLTQVTEGLQLRENGTMEAFYLDPSEADLKPVEMAELTAADPVESARKIQAVFEGQTGPVADVINLNTAAVLYMADRADSMATAFNQAREVQQSGKVAELLKRLIEYSNSGMI